MVILLVEKKITDQHYISSLNTAVKNARRWMNKWMYECGRGLNTWVKKTNEKLIRIWKIWAKSENYLKKQKSLQKIKKVYKKSKKFTFDHKNLPQVIRPLFSPHVVDISVWKFHLKNTRTWIPSHIFIKFIPLHFLSTHT